MRNAAVAALLALLVPVTTLAQPMQQAPVVVQPAPPPPTVVPMTQPPPPPVVQGQIIVPAPIAQQPPPMMGPRTLPYDEGGPIPPGYVLEERSRRGLIIAGSVILGVLYLTSLMIYTFVDAIDDDAGNDTWPLTIPVIGPFVTIGTTGADMESGASLLVFDGIGQGAGLVMMILGIVSKKQVWVRADLADLHLEPLAFARGGRGLALAGSF